MAFADPGRIGKAGMFLLGVLAREGMVRFSRFYDGTDETHLTITKEMGFGPGYYDTMEPETFLDYAVEQLEEQGVISTTKLEHMLFGDELPDFTITLTDRGQKLLAEGATFTFRWSRDG